MQLHKDACIVSALSLLFFQLDIEDDEDLGSSLPLIRNANLMQLVGFIIEIIM